LGKYLSVNPKKIEFSYNPYGKPSLKPSNMQKGIGFNVSHAEDYILFAVSQNEGVGIDIEYLDPQFSTQEIAEQFFSSSEAAVFQSLPENFKTEAFFNCWTRKEAFIKAIGEGLSCPLKDFDVSLRPGDPAKLLEIRRPGASASEWGLFDIEVGKDYKAALAVKGSVNQLKYYRYL
jgi:4'-phosphopantetheinyl transferase